MQRTLILAACVAAAGFSSAHAQPKAQDGAALAKQKNCLACHTSDKRLVGPSYKEVAAKYAGNKQASNLLVTKIMKGGSGVWGAVPMPPQPVSDKEAHVLAEWVLSHK